MSQSVRHDNLHYQLLDDSIISEELEVIQRADITGKAEKNPHSKELTYVRHFSFTRVRRCVTLSYDRMTYKETKDV